MAELGRTVSVRQIVRVFSPHVSFPTPAEAVSIRFCLANIDRGAGDGGDEGGDDDVDGGGDGGDDGGGGGEGCGDGGDGSSQARSRLRIEGRSPEL